jgi:hypothetical protein
VRIILEGREVDEYLAWRYGYDSLRLQFLVTEMETGEITILEDGMAKELMVDKKYKITAQLVDQYGNVVPSTRANLPPVQFSLADPNLLNLTPIDASSVYVFSPSGIVGGEDTLNASAGTWTGAIIFAPVAGDPVGINLSVGTPEPK